MRVSQEGREKKGVYLYWRRKAATRSEVRRVKCDDSTSQDLEAPKTTATNQSGYRVLNRNSELIVERGENRR